MIDDYRFGRMTIHGREYTIDLILYSDGRIQDSWWRASGHQLVAADIAELIAAAPEVIVAGTGASGLMRPAPGLADALAGQGIEFIARPTAEAATLYNQLVGKGKKVGGCFHLTC